MHDAATLSDGLHSAAERRMRVSAERDADAGRDMLPDRPGDRGWQVLSVGSDCFAVAVAGAVGPSWEMLLGRPGDQAFGVLRAGSAVAARRLLRLPARLVAVPRRRRMLRAGQHRAERPVRVPDAVVVAAADGAALSARRDLPRRTLLARRVGTDHCPADRRRRSGFAVRARPGLPQWRLWAGRDGADRCPVDRRRRSGFAVRARPDLSRRTLRLADRDDHETADAARAAVAVAPAVHGPPVGDPRPGTDAGEEILPLAPLTSRRDETAVAAPAAREEKGRYREEFRTPSGVGKSPRNEPAVCRAGLMGI